MKIAILLMLCASNLHAMQQDEPPINYPIKRVEKVPDIALKMGHDYIKYKIKQEDEAHLPISAPLQKKEKNE